MAFTATPGMSVISFKKPSKTVHKCRVCFKSFKRSEHRTRHERSHTLEKPYVCRICGRQYARSDLLTRHGRTIHTKQQHSEQLNDPNSIAFISHDGLGNRSIQAPLATPDSGHNQALDIGLLPPTPPSRPIEHNNEELSDSNETLVSAVTFQPTLDLSSDFDMLGRDEMSLSFFDPFFGKMFNHFAFPIFDGQLENISTLGLPLDDSLCQPDTMRTSHAHEPASPELSNGSVDLPETDATFPEIRERRSNDPLQILRPTKAGRRRVVFTEEMRASLSAEISSHVAPHQLKSFHLPDASSLQKYLDTYIDAFHIHFPFLHLQTLDLGATPGPLVLSICAVGALHRLERKLAASFYFMAERLLAMLEFDNLNASPTLLQDWARPQESPSSKPTPLALAQARLIQVFFSAFSGEPQLVRNALIACGHLSADFRLEMSNIKPGSSASHLKSWRSWVEHESMKRLMCCCTVLGNLLNITYGMAPGFAFVEECNIEMPAEDALWEAKTANEWQILMEATCHSPSLGLREAVGALFDPSTLERQPKSCWKWSPFSASIVMHGIATALWFLMQGKQACYGTLPNFRESYESTHVEAALSRCGVLLAEAQSNNDYTWEEIDNPLLFNAFAVLRVSYGRLCINTHSLDRSLLFKESSGQILAILQKYFEAKQERSQFITMAVTRALEGFAIPIRAGILLIQKTAAFKWSVEHAIAGWDAALLVTKWVFTIECVQNAGGLTTSEEAQVLKDVRELLGNFDFDRSLVRPLAADLARMWAGLYDDTWVWGVTPRIGWILRELARMCERDINTG
ncbi:Early growth response protein 3 [Paramyrothecium foliicola]|nr:Early growth response protein 3 [Paramyrothecium foliicola]